MSSLGQIMQEGQQKISMIFINNLGSSSTLAFQEVLDTLTSIKRMRDKIKITKKDQICMLSSGYPKLHLNHIKSITTTYPTQSSNSQISWYKNYSIKCIR